MESHAPIRPYEMVRLWARWPALRWYLGAALSITIAGGVVQWLVVPPTGLTRTFYLQTGPEDEDLEFPPERTTDISLTFLDDTPALPRRSFGVEWTGYWYVPRLQTVELLAGGDDRVEILVDDVLVHQRNPVAGMHTTAETIRLGEGAHRLVIRFEQDGGGMYLNVEHAVGGAAPAPLAPTQLFSELPDAADFALATGAVWFGRVTVALWLVPLGGLLLSGVVWGGARVARYWYAAGFRGAIGEFGRRLRLVCFPALMVPFVLFWLGPHTIYNANRGEFSGGFADIAWPWLLIATGGGWVLLLGVGGIVSIASYRLTRLYAVLLLALGFLFWAQGNLWVGNYGVLDGREIEWDRFADRVPYEIAVWVAVSFTALGFSRQLSRIVPFTAQLFLALQIAGLALTWGGAEGDQRTRWEEPPPEIFQFSNSANVIHVVLDEFQSDAFAVLLEDDRSWFDRRFTGFTFFADHLSAFPSTSLSMPTLLTGRVYRNEQPVPEFIRETFSEWSIFKSLSDAGYSIDATSIIPRPWFEAWFGPADSAMNKNGARYVIPKPFVSRDDYYESRSRQLLELSMSRHVPHVAKIALANNPPWFDRMLAFNHSSIEGSQRQHEASNSAAFLEQFIERMSIGRGRPVYKLLHVGVPHRPIVLDAECRFIDLTPISAGTYTDQSRCALILVADLLARLRDFGIYDQSLIVVSSDHGTDTAGGLGSPLLPEFAGRSVGLPMYSGPTTPGLLRIVGAARTLMAVKPPGSTGPLAVSHVPTTHADLPGTMLGLLGVPHSLEGQSMFDLSSSAVRRRVFGMYDLAFRFPDGYLDRLDLLTVDRDSADAEGWDWARSVLAPDQILRASVMDFGEGQNTAHLGPGWSYGRVERTERKEDISFVGAISKRAVVFVSLPTDEVELTAHVSGPSNGSLESIQVGADGYHVGLWRPEAGPSFQDYTARLPPDPERPHVSTITFVFEAASTDDIIAKLDWISVRSR